MNRRQRRAQGSAAPLCPEGAAAQLFGQAVRHHQAGQAEQAEALYSRVLALDPRHAEALHLLGVLALEAGRPDRAEPLIVRALRIDPTRAPFHVNLGHAADALRRHDAAILAFDAAIRLRPDHLPARLGLGNALRSAGRLAQAVAAYQAALRIEPGFADAHANLGVALRELGRLEDAVSAFRTATRLQPDASGAHFNLANALAASGRTEEAVDAYATVLRLQPGFAEARCNLGNALAAAKRRDEAVAAYRAAVAAKPDYAEAWTNLGNALGAAGRLGEAIAAQQAAIRLRPGFARAHSNLANLLTDAGRFGEAVAAHETAICLDPDRPDAQSSLLMTLHYRDGAVPEAIPAAARRFAALVERPGPTRSFANPIDPDRRLRVGYVSADLGPHPVGHFLRPVLPCHDRNAIEVTCYNNGVHAGPVADALRAASDRWRSLVGLPDEAAAAMIAADGIDILVDLSGHTAGNRLTLFARRAAPLQASWLGYWGTTGLSEMDVILSDATTILPGEENGYSERVVRLPGSRFCFAPIDDAPLPATPPCTRGHPPTFGSFNNLAKLGPEVVRLWAALLRAAPGSRLLLKWKSLTDDGMRRHVQAQFAALGVDGERLLLRGESAHRATLDEYRDVDVALDPFPFSGGLTSCDALWMGVPVVTLPGRAPQSRQTAGFLHAIGITGWTARTPEHYVSTALSLLSDPQELGRLRQSLRGRLAASSLCDGRSFARGLEAAYRAMWHGWCEQASGPAADPC